MNGKLEPDERVLDDSCQYPGGMLGQLTVLEKLGWSTVMRLMWRSEELTLGIDVGEEYNKKYSLRLCTLVSTTKTSFIIIKNQSRRDF